MQAPKNDPWFAKGNASVEKATKGEIRLVKTKSYQ